MKYEMRNGNGKHIVEGEDLEEIIKKFTEEDPDRAQESFVWRKVED